MSDEPPFFPPPMAKGEASPYRETPSAPATPIVSAPARVVTRPEPVIESDEPGSPPPKAKLSHDEIRALATLGLAEHQSKWAKAGKRTGVIFVPTTLLSLAAHIFAGHYAWALEFVISIATLAWISRPFWKKTAFD